MTAAESILAGIIATAILEQAPPFASGLWPGAYAEAWDWYHRSLRYGLVYRWQALLMPTQRERRDARRALMRAGLLPAPRPVYVQPAEDRAAADDWARAKRERAARLAKRGRLGERLASSILDRWAAGRWGRSV